MNRKLSITFLALAAILLGCGKDTSENSTPAGEPISKAIDGSKDDMARAEARKAELDRGKVTEPAVDTSSFRDAPAWSLPAMSGGALSSGDLEGKVVLVDFWATWCGPCRMSIPHLVQLYNEYKDQGVEIVGVSLDRQGAPRVKPFMDAFKINYPIVIGNGKVVQDFGGVPGIPTAFIISQDGKIYRKYVGFRPKEYYEKDIRTLLGLPT